MQGPPGLLGEMGHRGSNGDVVSSLEIKKIPLPASMKTSMFPTHRACPDFGEKEGSKETLDYP